MNSNRLAFLDMIAFSEGTSTVKDSDNGYNVIVGRALFDTHDTPEMFDDYADHPRKYVYLPKLKIKSSAAGRYQLLAKYFDAYKVQLNLPDFSPDSQDKIALQQIKECKALDDIDSGRFELAVKKCSRIWASFPNAGYGQHENNLEKLKLAYLKAGGTTIA